MDREGLGHVLVRLQVFVSRPQESGPESSEGRRPKEGPVSAHLSGPGYGGPGRNTGPPLPFLHTSHGSM